VSAPAAVAQNQSGAIRGGALRVFLDCNTFQCDSDHFRTEIDFVNWVRDRTLADVHLIVTSNQTGGGGNVFTLDFIGQGDLQGDDDELALTVIATDTEDEVLTALTGVMAAGLARYSAAIGQAASVAISAIDPGGVSTDELVGAEQVDDPWNFWVFEIGADIELEGEDFENQRQYEGRFDASRTTETWKFELDAFGSWTREEIQLDSGEVEIDERNNWNVDFLLARAIGAQWSLGLVAGAGASSRLNQEFGADASVALEYSFLPYVEAPRRSLTAVRLLEMPGHRLIDALFLDELDQAQLHGLIAVFGRRLTLHDHARPRLQHRNRHHRAVGTENLSHPNLFSKYSWRHVTTFASYLRSPVDSKLSLAAEGLNFHIHTGGQIEPHQCVDRLLRGFENVEQPLVRANFELFPRSLVGVRRPQHRIAILHRGQGNRPRHARARALGRIDDFAGRLVKHSVIVRL
jgi:hypothetical protein